MARKISQFNTYTWDEDTFEKAYIPIIAPNKNNVAVVNEENTYEDYINYKFNAKDLLLSNYGFYDTNSLIVTDNSGTITFKTDFSGSKVLLSKKPGLIEESSITTNELNCLSGITSNIQNQLNAKLPKIFSGLNDNNKVVVTNNSRNITISNITTSELNCLSGITSNIKEELGTKAPIDSPEFDGTPKAPTPKVGTNNTEIATTEFVNKSINAR